MTTLAPPLAQPEASSAYHLADDAPPDRNEQHRCECPNDHAAERKVLQRLVPRYEDDGGDTWVEVAQVRGRSKYECDRVDALGLCPLCLVRGAGDVFTAVPVLGPVTGPCGPRAWSGTRPHGA